MRCAKVIFSAVTAAVMMCVACGTEASPSQMIIGSWDADMNGEVRSVEFRADGSVQPEGEELQRYTVIEGEPHLVQITPLDSDDISVEVELVFEDEDHCTLSADGMTVNLTRIE